MALVTHTIQNLMNGVSQQPPTIRLSSQCKEQVNATCRVTDGLSKRLAVQVKKVGTVYEDIEAEYLTFEDADCRFHTIAGVDAVSGLPRKAQLIVHGPTGVLAYQILEGDFTPASGVLGIYNYLDGATKAGLRFLTNGNKTYILNKDRPVQWDVLNVPDEGNTEQIRQGALGYVAQGFFGTTYSLRVVAYNTLTGATPYSTSTFTYTTNSSSATTDLTGIQTATIANGATGLGKLLADYVANPANTWFNAETEVVRANNWFQIKFKAGSTALDPIELRMEVSSTTASTAIYGFNGVCGDVVKLPVTAPEGYSMRIDADPTSSEDQYYLVYESRVNGWVEGLKKGDQGVFDENTLPLVVDFGTFDFTVAPLVINSRTVGDSEVSPHPSFIGNKINDLFIFNNRLGFLSQNNLIMSKIDDFSTFYRSSVASNLASDRVDLTAAVPSTRYSNLNSAVPFETALMLFGDSAQYLLQTNTGFDVTKTSLQTSNEYDADITCQPINIGSSIYFPVRRGEYSGVFDLSRKDGIGLTAEEATHHVPTYIKGQIIEMTYSSVENMVFVRTLEEPKTIYVQNRFVRQTVLEQNAWHKWTLPENIVHMQVVGSELFVTMANNVANGSKLLYTYIDIATKRIEPTTDLEIEFTPHLDLLRFIPEGSVVSTSFFAADNVYYPPALASQLVGVNINGGQVQGLAAINLALEDGPLWVGVPFTFQYIFSEQVPAAESDRGKLVYQFGRLILRSMKISYSNTGRFDIKVTPTGRPTNTTSFSGLILGSILSVVGKINISTGVFKFPVNARSNEVEVKIESTYPYPCTFNTCEWQGTFTNQSGRM